MNQFNVRREYVFQAEAINGVRVTAIHFHDSIVTVGVGQAADFLSRLTDYLWVAIFVNVLHFLRPKTRDKGYGSSPYDRRGYDAQATANRGDASPFPDPVSRTPVSRGRRQPVF